MKSSKNRWADHYSRQAKKDRYPARSVYKLKEIQSRYRLIRPGDKILDLGCSPGSWLLYAAEIAGKKGNVIGIDLKPVTIGLPPQVVVHVGDVQALEDDLIEKLGHDFNAVISDMAPSTSGIKDVDTARSLDLCTAALAVARRFLAPGGTFLCKIFQGADFDAFSRRVKENFNKQKIFKPRSSRKASREIYMIGTGKKD
jgi:23S rRNA (uridine2552-2'-O)-methyltransferase